MAWEKNDISLLKVIVAHAQDCLIKNITFDNGGLVSKWGEIGLSLACSSTQKARVEN
jgi:hypothetical protein